MEQRRDMDKKTHLCKLVTFLSVCVGKVRKVSGMTTEMTTGNATGKGKRKIKNIEHCFVVSCLELYSKCTRK
ncbi:MAG: hypothetical protein D3916_05190 [Candidatus Electrothrix sp. MAN1_4]|nr:hypothetical protein [Candidatus Electrothrix sp. MAN1_4]